MLQNQEDDKSSFGTQGQGTTTQEFIGKNLDFLRLQKIMHTRF